MARKGNRPAPKAFRKALRESWVKQAAASEKRDPPGCGVNSSAWGARVVFRGGCSRRTRSRRSATMARPCSALRNAEGCPRRN